jgi:hypothetical protein
MALPLITIATDGKFNVNSTTLKKLQSTTGPLAIVSVAGLYRTGKSYLLNRLLKRQSGFKVRKFRLHFHMNLTKQVGPTINPCTRGIYIWGEPIQREGYSIILMDTEGLGSVQQDQNHDTKVLL